MASTLIKPPLYRLILAAPPLAIIIALALWSAPRSPLPPANTTSTAPQSIQTHSRTDHPKSTQAKKPIAESIATKININTATQQELQALPRIGPTLSQRIIDYRQDNGPFQTIKQLDNVKGIGPKTLEALTPFITTQPTTSPPEQSN